MLELTKYGTLLLVIGIPPPYRENHTLLLPLPQPSFLSLFSLFFLFLSFFHFLSLLFLSFFFLCPVAFLRKLVLTFYYKRSIYLLVYYVLYISSYLFLVETTIRKKKG